MTLMNTKTEVIFLQINNNINKIAHLPYYIFVILCFFIGNTTNAQDCNAPDLFINTFSFDAGELTIDLSSVDVGETDQPFNLQFSIGDEITSDVQSTVNPPSFLVNGPLENPFVNYSFTVQGSCADGTLTTGATVGIDATAENLSFDCPLPTNLRLESLSLNTATLSWDNVTLGSGFFYQILYKGIISESDLNSFIIDLDTTQCSHEITVRSKCGDNVSPSYKIIIITTVDDVKLAPTDSLCCTNDFYARLDSAFVINCSHQYWGSSKRNFATHLDNLFSVPVPFNGCWFALTDIYTNDFNPPLSNVNLLPNPTYTQQIQLDYQLNIPTYVSIDILNVQGQLVSHSLVNQYKNASQHQQTIIMPANAGSGIYYIKLSTLQKTQYHRFVKF